MAVSYIHFIRKIQSDHVYILPFFLTHSCSKMKDCNGKSQSVCAGSKMPHSRQKMDIVVCSMISTLQWCG